MDIIDNIKKTSYKPFVDLKIADDFMFGAVMSDGDNLKLLLEYILNIKIKHIKQPEKNEYIDLNESSRYGFTNFKLNVSCEDENNTFYSIKIQLLNNQNLAKSIEYNHNMICHSIIDKDENSQKLIKKYAIFICCFDAFGKERYKYTFKHQCQEDNGISFDDDTTLIVLNTKGTVGEINKELKNVFDFINGERPSSEFAFKLLDSIMKIMSHSETWFADYIKRFRIKMLFLSRFQAMKALRYGQIGVYGLKEHEDIPIKLIYAQADSSKNTNEYLEYEGVYLKTNLDGDVVFKDGKEIPFDNIVAIINNPHDWMELK